MQYQQSFCGIPRCSTFFPCSPCTPAPVLPCNTPYPSVVGEGDVTTLVLPDGTSQLYFLPVYKGCSPPNLYNQNIPNYNPYCNTNSGIWFVRSVSNPIPHPLYQQQTPMPCETAYQRYFSCDKALPRPWTSFGNFALPSPECYINKFHNDSCSSTTDLVYFFPRLRSCMAPRASAGVQVSAPVDTGTGGSQCEMVCKQPCTCPDGREVTTEAERSGPFTSKSSKKFKDKMKKRSNGIVICECNTSESDITVSSQTCMSVDEIRSISEESMKRGKTKENKHKVKSSKNDSKKNSNERKRDDHICCECYRFDSSTESSRSSKSTEETKQKNKASKKEKKINNNKQVYEENKQKVNSFINTSNKTAKEEKGNEYNCKSCSSVSSTGREKIQQTEKSYRKKLGKTKEGKQKAKSPRNESKKIAKKKTAKDIICECYSSGRKDYKCESCSSVSSTGSMSIEEIKPNEKSYSKKLDITKYKERKQNIKSSKNESKKNAKKEKSNDVICECYSSDSFTGRSQYNMSNEMIKPKEKVCCRGVQNSRYYTTGSDKTIDSSQSYTYSTTAVRDPNLREKCCNKFSTLTSNNVVESGQTRDIFCIDSTMEPGDTLSKIKEEQIFSSCGFGADTKRKETGMHHECECGKCELEYLNKLAAISSGQATDCIAQSGQQTQVSHSNVAELWFPKGNVETQAVFLESMSVSASETNSIYTSNLY